MENNKSNAIQTHPALVFASLIIIIAGLMNAVSMVNAILMGLFLSIICAQPIAWLQTKKVPNTVALVHRFSWNNCSFFLFY